VADPLLTRDALRRSAESIIAAREPHGAIPWFPGGHTDPWDHLECLMALQVTGHLAEADTGYRWLARTQRPDGSWPMATVNGTVTETAADSNQCAYVATAVWHRWLATRDREFVRRTWPMVRAALDFVVTLAAPGGEIWWARDAFGQPDRKALLTGCASTLHSLRCGVGLAALVGERRVGWERAATGLRHALRAHPDSFEPLSRYSMDWYYPVIGGALRGQAGQARLQARWAEFVVPGLGARCVADEPWVTGAETCELAIAAHLLGARSAARALVADMQHLRRPDGAYWTGYQFDQKINWPDEQSTWTAAAVILAVDTTAGGPTEATFRGDGLPALLPRAALEGPPSCDCPARRDAPVIRLTGRSSAEAGGASRRSTSG
jgi:hypothetical protein